MHDLKLPIDQQKLRAELDEIGYALLPGLLPPEECRQSAALHGQEDLFRSRVVMARHGFGQGEYKYFAYPLPERIGELRRRLYPPLAAIANEWNARLSLPQHFPERHEDYLAECHAAGQLRPTPLLLRYGSGDVYG